MSKFGVLRCPVCDDIRLCPVDEFDDPADLKEVASEHLRSHRLTESKHGIFRVMMVQELSRVEMEQPATVPTQQWTDELDSVSV